MNWTRLVAIAIGTGIVSSLTDWLFAGDWLHRRYTYPEIWRKGAEGRAIALSGELGPDPLRVQNRLASFRCGRGWQSTFLQSKEAYSEAQAKGIS